MRKKNGVELGGGGVVEGVGEVGRRESMIRISCIEKLFSIKSSNYNPIFYVFVSYCFKSVLNIHYIRQYFS